MITDAFDKSEVLFGPKDFYGEKKNLCDKCVIIFSEVIFEYMLETYEHEQAGIIRCCNGVTAVYVFEIDEMKIAGYLSHIGSALAGSDVIDANWLTGADKEQHPYLLCFCACNGLLGSASVTFLPIISR